MKFFIDCKTISEAKEVYRKLAKVFHPDKGGDAELFRELQKQHDEWSPQMNMYTPNNMGNWRSSIFQYNPNIPTDLSKDNVDKNKINDIENELFVLKKLSQERYETMERLRCEKVDLFLENRSLEILLKKEQNKSLWEHIKDWWNNE